MGNLSQKRIFSRAVTEKSSSAENNTGKNNGVTGTEKCATRFTVTFFAVTQWHSETVVVSKIRARSGMI